MTPAEYNAAEMAVEDGLWPDDPIRDDWVRMWTEVFDLLYADEGS